MRSIIFEGNTWAEYEKLRRKDKATHKNLCRILQEMQRNDPALGTGKPEALKYELSGLWSRRISHRDRLIYTFDEQSISIFALGGHYDTIR
jgi:toxin YoeB